MSAAPFSVTHHCPPSRIATRKGFVRDEDVTESRRQRGRRRRIQASIKATPTVGAFHRPPSRPVLGAQRRPRINGCSSSNLGTANKKTKSRPCLLSFTLPRRSRR